jgi:hypothetical protein
MESRLLVGFTANKSLHPFFLCAYCQLTFGLSPCKIRYCSTFTLRHFMPIWALAGNMCDITTRSNKIPSKKWRINLHTVANSLTKLTKTRECRYRCCLYGKRSIMSMLHNNIWPQWDISILGTIYLTIVW